MQFHEDWMNSLERWGPDWAGPAMASAVTLLLALLVHLLLRRLVLRATRHFPVASVVAQRTGAPLIALVSLTLLGILWQALPDEVPAIVLVRRLLNVLWTASATWLALRCVAIARQTVIQRHPYDVADNLRARTVLTQAKVYARTLYVLILLIGVSLILMSFPGVRKFGTSLLASAGIAGLALGLAAKPVLGNLLAGLQIAMTQPIRIDDVLVLEGEWGRVEEITGTYVVLAIWDQRRLIVPLQYFIERPFQNWTRSTSQILGTVMLWVDYRLPVEPVRAELRRLCAQDKDWDGRVALVQVTDSNERSMQLRVLLSSADSGRNFDLRCRVREALIAYIGREYPLCLPQLRVARINPLAPGIAAVPAIMPDSPTPTRPA